MNSNGTYALQASAVTIDNESGLVTAIVGGRSQEGVSQDYNRAYLSFRQPGSSIKPLIVYTPALERGYSASSTVIVPKRWMDRPTRATGMPVPSLCARLWSSPRTQLPINCSKN